MTFTYDLVLGMPHTNRRGLWEPTLLKYAGHFQWQAIAAAIGRPLSTLRTIGGGEIYAAFYFTRAAVPDTAPLESFKVDDIVRLSIALRRLQEHFDRGLDARWSVPVRQTRWMRTGHPVREHFHQPVSGNTELKVDAARRC